MSNYTTVDESKELNKILGTKYADMRWEISYFSTKSGVIEYDQYPQFGYIDKFLPCWSTEALLHIINQSNIREAYLEIDFDKPDAYYVYFNDIYHSDSDDNMYSVRTTDITYALYRIIIILNEKRLL